MRNGPHCDPPINQEERSDCYNPGLDRSFGKIMPKFCNWRQNVEFWRNFEVEIRDLSTPLRNSVKTTARQSTLLPKKSIGYAQLWSGSNILREMIEKPVLRYLGRFRPNFERTMCALSTQPANSVLSTAGQFF